MTDRYVICANDYPHAILPAGTSQDEMERVVSRLNEEDAKIVTEEKYPHSFNRVYYTAHLIREVKPADVPRAYGRR